MKTEEKNTKRFWRRGNVLDIAIILLVLAAIVTIAYRYYQSTTEAQNDVQDTVVITFEVKGAPSAMPQAVTADETLYLSSTGDAFGQIVAHGEATDGTPFKITPVEVMMQDEQGNWVSTVMPDGTVGFVGTVSCLGIMDEDGSFSLGGRMPMTPGQTVAVYTERVSFVLTVVSVDDAAS